jgi:hypothetical protein
MGITATTFCQSPTTHHIIKKNLKKKKINSNRKSTARDVKVRNPTVAVARRP